jgi:hypothetical protein
MKNKNTIMTVILIFTIGFATTIFIIKSNDHIECETVVKKYKNNNGDMVTLKEHVCKEKYSL